MMRLLFYTVIGAVLGGISWCGEPGGFLLLPLVFAAWARMPGRRYAFALMLGYYLGAARDIPSAGVVFLGGTSFSALALWLLHAALLASAWLLCWPGRNAGWGRMTRCVLAVYLLTILPPYGVFGWAHPLTAAGMYFPGWGWWGIVAYVPLTLFASLMASGGAGERGGRIAIAAGLLSLSIAANAADVPLSPPDGWQAASTALGRFPVTLEGRYKRHKELQRQAVAAVGRGARVTLFPESVAGPWSAIEAALWQEVDSVAREKRAVILLGVAYHRSVKRYDNALLALGDGGALIKARIPMPVGEWNSFARRSAMLNLTESGRAVIAGRPVAVFICYEIMLPWAVLQSMAIPPRPEVFLVPSNLWWAGNTAIPAIMNATAHAWARLFGLNVLNAKNT